MVKQVLNNRHLVSIQMSGFISLIADSSVSILNFWYVTDWLRYFRLKIALKAPDSFFGRRKIGEIICPRSITETSMISFAKNFSISASMACCSSKENVHSGYVVLKVLKPAGLRV